VRADSVIILKSPQYVEIAERRPMDLIIKRMESAKKN
jgi:hypothetical protein